MRAVDAAGNEVHTLLGRGSQPATVCVPRVDVVQPGSQTRNQPSHSLEPQYFNHCAHIKGPQSCNTERTATGAVHILTSRHQPAIAWKLPEERSTLLQIDRPVAPSCP